MKTRTAKKEAASIQAELKKSGSRSFEETITLILKVKEKIERLEGSEKSSTAGNSSIPHVRFL